MFAVERQKYILDQLAEYGAVLVNKLSAELNVTEETVRRDLEKLENQELLVRTHGGAIPLEENNIELSLEKRKKLNSDIKMKLAKEAVKMIARGDTVFLDASTTTFYMAKEIKKMNNVTVVTNSLRVINELSNSNDITVISVGGIVSNNQSFVGTHTESIIRDNFFVNKMFFSSRGITINGEILESNERECGVKKSMLNNSSEKIYLCDKSKVGRVGFAKLCTITDIDCMITEKVADEKLLNNLAENGILVSEI